MKRYVSIAAVLAILASSALSQERQYMLVRQRGLHGYTYNLGPSGIWAGGAHTDAGLEPDQEVTFAVRHVELNSPAFGKVFERDIITGANGRTFPRGKDPRYAMAYAIEDSEAKDGSLVLDIIRNAKSIKVTVMLDKLPALSPTWPFDCDRTDMVLQKACEMLRREQMPEGDVPADDGNIGTALSGLLWLSMGEPRYMQNALRSAYWYKERVEEGRAGWCWSMGYGGILLSEYYLMTGDKNILPGVEAAAAAIAKAQMPNGAWSHWGFNGYNAGYGAVNLAGMSCYTALLLARECGVEVDNGAIAKADRYFEAFAPTLSNKYGNNPMDYTKMDYTGANGKAGCISVAHRLNNKLLYSRNFGLKAARSMDRLEKGHTGHFFNAMWTPIAASMCGEPEDYRACLDQMGWYLTLARHWRGGLWCPPSRGGSKYSSEGGVNMTTGGYGLVLAAPRRHLRILGAPKSVFSVQLPKELEAAKKLHQDHQWDAAIAAVDAFLKKGGHDDETVRLANELRDKSRYVQAGVQEAYRKLEGLTGVRDHLKAKMSSRPNKVMGIMGRLRMMLGEDDPRLKEIEGYLPEAYRPIWRHGKNYNQSLRTIRELSTYGWFVFASLLRKEIPDFANPGDSPDFDEIVVTSPENESLKVMVVKPDAEMPKGWADLDFDDSSWKNKFEKPAWETGGRRRKKNEPVGPQPQVLARIPFELKSTCVNLLRVRAPKGLLGLPQGSKVYINGECVMAGSGISTSKKSSRDTSVTLLEAVRHLLKRGENVLAIASPGVMAQVALDGDGVFSRTIDWTVEPGRDADIRKLVAKRRAPEPYYDFVKDKRTADECMKAFTAEPFFMPEAFNALMRFRVVIKDVPEREPYVEKLLKSSNWGARWTALNIMSWDMGVFGKTFEIGAYYRKMKGADPALIAKSPTVKEDSYAMAEKFLPEIIGLLGDPHPTVQKEACAVVKLLGPKAKDAFPALLKIVKDAGMDGEPFRTRNEAFEAIFKIEPGAAALDEAVRVGFTDPAYTVRNTVLNSTVTSRDEQVANTATERYKDEFIDQLFTLPVSKGGKKVLAAALLNRVSKDDLRPHLDDVFATLDHRSGAQLEGCINILLAFGEEVRPKLEELAQSDDMQIRFNTINTLLQMTTGDKLTPKRLEFLKTNIEPLLEWGNEQKAGIARHWLDALASGKQLYFSAKEISKAKAAKGVQSK